MVLLHNYTVALLYYVGHNVNLTTYIFCNIGLNKVFKNNYNNFLKIWNMNILLTEMLH